MNTFKLACLMPLLAITSVHALTVPCNGFKIIIENSLSEEINVSNVNLTGATITTDGPQVIGANKKQTYTVNETIEGNVMNGEFALNTTNPSSMKKIAIKFNLTNAKLLCELNEYPSTGDLSSSKTRLPGGVSYKVSY